MPSPDLGLTAVGDIVQLTFRGTLNSQRILNTFHYRIDDLGTGAVLRWDFLDAMRTVINAAGNLKEKFLACIASNYTMESSRYQFLYPQRMIFRDFPELSPGARAGNAVAPNLAASIERRTDVVGRTGVGRLQMPGLLAADIVLGYLSGAYATLAGTLATQMEQSLVVAPNSIIVDPSLYGVNVSGTPHWGNVIGATVQGTVRTMHRRTVGLGE